MTENPTPDTSPLSLALWEGYVQPILVTLRAARARLPADKRQLVLDEVADVIAEMYAADLEGIL